MKTIIKVLLLIIAASFTSCKSLDENWIVGEWVADDGTSFTITEDYHILFKSDWGNSSYLLEKEGEGFSYRFEDSWVSFDPSTKTAECGDLVSDDSEGPYHLAKPKSSKSTESTKDNKASVKTNSGKNSDKVWKSAFEENGGFLVFESLLTYSRGSYSTPTHLYIVLKGYGESRQKGMANIFLDGWAGWIGLYEMFDNVVMLYDLREEGKRGGREYSKPYTPLTSQFFTWENTTPITITGNFDNYSEKVTWKQISNDIAKYLSRDETFNN